MDVTGSAPNMPRELKRGSGRPAEPFSEEAVGTKDIWRDILVTRPVPSGIWRGGSESLSFPGDRPYILGTGLVRHERRGVQGCAWESTG